MLPDQTVIFQWLQQTISLDMLLQIGALALAIGLGFVLRALLLRVFDRLKARMERWSVARQYPWIIEIIVLVQRLAYPLAVVILIDVAVSLLRQLGQPTQLLGWLIFFTVLWLIYRLLCAIIDLRLPPTVAVTWKFQILRPVAGLIAVLQALGLLNNVLDFGLNPSAGVLISLRALLLGGAILYVFIILSRNARKFLREVLLPRAGVNPAVNQVISASAAYVVLTIGFLFALSTIGISLTTLTVIAGGVSVGIGFGMQTLVNNFISGFILLSERSLVPGDVVRVAETIGVVTDIRLRTTEIRTADNIELIVPNGLLLNNIVTNYTRDSTSIRLHINVGVRYDADPHAVISALLASSQHTLVLNTPMPSAQLIEFSETVMKFSLLVWTAEPGEAMKISSDIRLQIWDRFTMLRIPMIAAAPVSEIHTTPFSDMLSGKRGII